MIIYSRTSAKTAETPECSGEDTAFFTVGTELKSKMIYNREWQGGDTNMKCTGTSYYCYRMDH